MFQSLTQSKPWQEHNIYYYSLPDWLENVSKWSSQSITRRRRSVSRCGCKEAAGTSAASPLSASINCSSPQSIPPAKTPLCEAKMEKKKKKKIYGSCATRGKHRENSLWLEISMSGSWETLTIQGQTRRRRLFRIETQYSRCPLSYSGGALTIPGGMITHIVPRGGVE